MNRLEGAVILVNTFLPLIMLVLISTAVWITWDRLEDSLGAYQQSLERIVSNAEMIRDKLKVAAQEIADSATTIHQKGEDIGKKIDSVVTGFNQTIDQFGAVFSSAVKTLDIKVPIPVINKDVIIPFGSVLASPMRKVGNKLAKPFKPLSKSIGELGNSVSDIKKEIGRISDKVNQLRYMQAYLDVVVQEYKQVIKQIAAIMSVVASLFSGIAITLGILAIWFSLGYVMWIRRRLIKGLALLRGTPVTA